ncbi:MAG TPA: hypothetical protein VNI57_12745 [Candidatus Saccharimonadales bacterium]|nr:hypothetical protein [Candidatus Saccharimonadales bacterium]
MKPTSMPKPLLPVVLFLFLLVAFAAPGVRAAAVGSEFQVNTYTTAEQYQPAAAADAAGNFVIVWTSAPSTDTGTYPRPGQDGSESGIFGQRYDSTGLPLGAEFQINTYTTGYQLDPDVAGDANGNFIVVWDSAGQSPPRSDIYAQRYDSSGAPLGGEFQINESTTLSRSNPSVASDSDGNFVVAWEGSVAEIFARRYDSSGSPVGGEFQVNTGTTGYQSAPDVAVTPSGQFVVSWIRMYPAASGTRVTPMARIFDASGPVSDEIQVTSATSIQATDAAVTMDTSGEFVVVWNDILAAGGSGPGVFGQRFDATGAPEGGEFVIDSQGGDQYSSLDASMDQTGDFLVAWERPDGSDLGAAVQKFDSTGSPIGGAAQVNTYTSGDQVGPVIGQTPGGDFVVAWTTSTLGKPGENSPDGSASGVFAQLFSGATPPGPLVVQVRITPRKLNVKSKGHWVTAKIKLPDGYTVDAIDPATLEVTRLDGPGCPGPWIQPIDSGFGIRPRSTKKQTDTPKITAKIDRKKLIGAICLGEVRITMEGDLQTGEHFAGTDVIKAFLPGKAHGNGNGNGQGNGNANGHANGHGNGNGNGKGHGHGD